MIHVLANLIRRTAFKEQYGGLGAEGSMIGERRMRDEYVFRKYFVNSSTPDVSQIITKARAKETTLYEKPVGEVFLQDCW